MAITESSGSTAGRTHSRRSIVVAFLGVATLALAAVGCSSAGDASQDGEEGAPSGSSVSSGPSSLAATTIAPSDPTTTAATTTTSTPADTTTTLLPAATSTTTVAAATPGTTPRRVTPHTTVARPTLRRPATPGVPQLVSTESHRATLTVEPVDDGGTPIDRYEVLTSPGSVSDCTALPCAVEGLDNGANYTFRLRARNTIGWSEWSPSSAPYVPDEPPGVPGRPAAVAGDHSVTVSWGPLPNAGSEVLAVHIRASSGEEFVSPGGAAGGSYTVPGLTNGAPYSFAIKAVNRIGVSAWSPFSPTVVPAGVPNAPLLSATLLGGGSVMLGWAADGNGSPIIGYRLSWSGGPPLELTGPTTLFQFDGLSPGTTYTFTLQAINAVGIGIARSVSVSLPI